MKREFVSCFTTIHSPKRLNLRRNFDYPLHFGRDFQAVNVPAEKLAQLPQPGRSPLTDHHLTRIFHKDVEVGTPRRRGTGASRSDGFVTLATKCSAAERGGYGAARHPYLCFAALGRNGCEICGLSEMRDLERRVDQERGGDDLVSAWPQ